MSAGVLAGLGPLGLPEQALATFGGPNGDVAFSLNLDRGEDPAATDIWIVGPSGSNPVDISQQCVLASSGSYYQDIGQGIEPIWSPDGKELAFVGFKNLNAPNEQAALFTIRPDGSGRTQITGWGPSDAAGVPLHITWSPDGSQIAFADSPDESGQANTLYFVNLATRTISSVPGPSGRQGISTLAWSPTSNTIAFTSYSEPFEYDGYPNYATRDIYSMHTDGTGVQQLTNTGSSSDPDFSPDGTRIVFDTNYPRSIYGYPTGTSGIFTMNPDGTGVQAVTSDSQDPNYDVEFPSYSPDGGTILYEFASSATTGTSFYTIPAAGGTPAIFGDGNYYFGNAGDWGTDTTAPAAKPLCEDATVPTNQGPSTGQPGQGTSTQGPSTPSSATITHVRVRPRAFVPRTKGPSTTRKRGPNETTFTYSASRAEKVTFKVRHRVRGKLIGKTCIAPAPARKGRPCSRTQTLRGAFTQAARAGLNTLFFTGRLNGRTLQPGSYVLVLSAGGRSTSVSFSIRRSPAKHG